MGNPSEEKETRVDNDVQISTKSDETLKRSALKKNSERPKDFFGRYKPGGCLDPPFGEDRVPYSPANDEDQLNNENIMLNAPATSAENKPRSSSIFSNKILIWKHKKSTEVTQIGVKETKNGSVLDLYQSSPLRNSATLSNSIMTYPDMVKSSETQEQKRVSESYIGSSKNSFNEHSGPFFIRGTKKLKRTEEEINRNKEKADDIKPDRESQERPQVLEGSDLAMGVENENVDEKVPTSGHVPLDHKNANIIDKIPIIIPIITSVPDERQTKEIEKIDTPSSEQNIQSTISLENENLRLPGHSDEIIVETRKITPLSAKQTDDSGKTEYTSSDNMYHVNNSTSDQQIIKINHILTPQKFDVPQKKENDLEINHAHSQMNNDVPLLKKQDTVIKNQNINQSENITAPSSLKTTISNKVPDYTLSEIDAYKKESDKEQEPDKINLNLQKSEELSGRDILTCKDDIMSSSINEPTLDSEDKNNEDKFVRETSIYKITKNQNYPSKQVNQDYNILTPITTDTPIKREENDFQQLWENDIKSLESVPITPLAENKTYIREENKEKLLAKVPIPPDESLNVFDLSSKSNDQDNHISQFQNEKENVEYSLSGTENVKQTDLDDKDYVLYSIRDNDILEVPQSNTIVNADVHTKPIKDLNGDTKKIITKDAYDNGSISHKTASDESVMNQLDEFTKYDEKHIKFTDDIDLGLNYLDSGTTRKNDFPESHNIVSERESTNTSIVESSRETDSFFAHTDSGYTTGIVTQSTDGRVKSQSADTGSKVYLDTSEAQSYSSPARQKDVEVNSEYESLSSPDRLDGEILYDKTAHTEQLEQKPITDFEFMLENGSDNLTAGHNRKYSNDNDIRARSYSSPTRRSIERARSGPNQIKEKERVDMRSENTEFAPKYSYDKTALTYSEQLEQRPRTDLELKLESGSDDLIAGYDNKYPYDNDIRVRSHSSPTRRSIERSGYGTNQLQENEKVGIRSDITEFDPKYSYDKTALFHSDQLKEMPITDFEIEFETVRERPTDSRHEKYLYDSTIKTRSYSSPTRRAMEKRGYRENQMNESENMSESNTKYSHPSIVRSQSPQTFNVDLALQCYSDKNKNYIVKSFDSDTVPKRYHNDIVKLVKCELQITNEVLVPVSSNYDLVVEIRNNRFKNSANKADLRDRGLTGNASRNEIQNNPIKLDTAIVEDIRKTLLAVYQEELLPLRNTISELESNLKALTAHHKMALSGRNMIIKRSRLSSKGAVSLFRRCGCTNIRQ